METLRLLSPALSCALASWNTAPSGQTGRAFGGGGAISGLGGTGGAWRMRGARLIGLAWGSGLALAISMPKSTAALRMAPGVRPMMPAMTWGRLPRAARLRSSAMRPSVQKRGVLILPGFSVLMFCQTPFRLRVQTSGSLAALGLAGRGLGAARAGWPEGAA